MSWPWTKRQAGPEKHTPNPTHHPRVVKRTSQRERRIEVTPSWDEPAGWRGFYIRDTYTAKLREGRVWIHSPAGGASVPRGEARVIARWILEVTEEDEPVEEAV